MRGLYSGGYFGKYYGGIPAGAAVGALTEITPYVIGKTLAAAVSRITSVYCTAVSIGTSGTVISQAPPAFTVIARGSSITITMGGAITYVRKERNKRRGLPPYSAGVN
jgi:hypothetical protein